MTTFFMNERLNKTGTILVAGSNKLAFSITVCLLQAGHHVNLYTTHEEKALDIINQHAADIFNNTSATLSLVNLVINTELNQSEDYDLAIAITAENLDDKKGVVHELENVLPGNVIIAINAESILLSDIQNGSKNPARIIGANWVEPAHTTYFLEIISNETTQEELVNEFYNIAKHWKKDPYVVKGGYSIRGRMMSALIREAFYLVENGYVSFEDVDRACRNDAGYYLPFAGNFRYMDLMGTYIYGLVMKDMNPDLSKDRHIPQFFTDIISTGGRGMENNRGLYQYKEGEVERWNELSRTFSYQIQEIIEKYPFKYLEKEPEPEHKTLTV
jgi:3-hydroxybutyryl-CoA dehydrogenase